MMDDTRRFGRVYSRRRNREIHIGQQNNHLLEINGFNVIRRPRTQRARRVNYSNIISIFTHISLTRLTTNLMVDVPVHLEEQHRNSRICHVPQILPNLIEVPIEVAHTAAEIRGSKRLRHEENHIQHAPLGTFLAPASTSSSTKKPRTTRLPRHNFDHIILPMNTGITSTRSLRGTQTLDGRRAADRIRQRNYYNRQTPEQRAARQALQNARRRVMRARNRASQQLTISNFDHEVRTTQKNYYKRIRQRNYYRRQTPAQRAARQALQNAHRRVMRATNRESQQFNVNESMISPTDRNRIRKRKSRASHTISARILARALNTVQKRNSRHRHSQQRNLPNDPTEAPLSNGQLFRKAINEIEWGWCNKCNTRFPDMSARGLCDFCDKDNQKHPEGTLFSAANMMDPGPVPIELSRLTELETLLIARVHPMMFSLEEKIRFKYALRLFPTKDAANNYNQERLKDIGNPIARIDSKNNCDAARRARSDEAKGLQQILLLSKGARVMLRTNIATRYGLVNGARGIVVDIVYRDGEKSPTHMPIAVMVEFDKYTGPTLYQQSTIIPIVPQTTNWKTSSGITCQRTQIPLILCWAITVHKSQGLTLDQAVVDIGQRESLGLSFVALSRTRKLRDLAFYPMFNYDRLQKIGKCQGLLKRRQEEERLKQLSHPT